MPSLACEACGVMVRTMNADGEAVYVNHSNPDGERCAASRRAVPGAATPADGDPRDELDLGARLEVDGICMSDGTYHRPVRWVDRHNIEHTSCELDEEEWPCPTYLRHLDVLAKATARAEPPQPSRDPVLRVADDVAAYYHRLLSQGIPAAEATKMALAFQALRIKPLLARLVFDKTGGAVRGNGVMEGSHATVEG